MVSSTKKCYILVLKYEIIEKPLYGELRSSSDFMDSCIESVVSAITCSLMLLDEQCSAGSLSSKVATVMVSFDSTILIVDSSGANFALTFSCDDETSMETSEASLVFFFLQTPLVYVMDCQQASPINNSKNNKSLPLIVLGYINISWKLSIFHTRLLETRFYHLYSIESI